MTLSGEPAASRSRDIHRPFVLPRRGVIWKMAEDPSASYPGYGLGAMDAFDGYVIYRPLDSQVRKCRGTSISYFSRPSGIPVKYGRR